MSKILITAKINPDLDGLACAYAYAQFLNKTDTANEYIAGVYGEPQIEARFVLEKLGIIDGLIFNPVDDFAKFIIVDASDVLGMPEIIRPLDVVEVIDHRAVHRASELFPQAKIEIEPVGAAATLILEKLRSANFSLSANQVALLLGAIFSNTLNLQADITSLRDRQAIEFLQSNYLDYIPENFIAEMFAYKTNYLLTHLAEVLISDFKVFPGALGIAQLEGVDLELIINNQIQEIKRVLEELKNKHNLEYIFLTCADISKGYNFLVATDEATKLLLSKSMNLLFNSAGIAKTNKLFLRKQILPLLFR